MNVLLTGASSFTGHWFARELAVSGHKVVAPLQRAMLDYSGVRAERVARLSKFEGLEVVWSAPFGESKFMELLGRPFDLLCHHAARMTDYRSSDFDVITALAENTRNLPQILQAMRRNGLRGVVLTGSIFEADEGAGSSPLRAFSPYGVSKEITAAVMRYWCAVLEVPLGKFVISNPFGPLEEPRFCSYLVNTWRKSGVAEVRTPRYVRDNIHVDLLAKVYRAFAEATINGPNFSRINPSGYVESQGAFAQRFAREIGPRLGLAAQLELREQTEFPEPLMRVNTDPAAGEAYGWRESEAWDRLANYYKAVV